MSFASSFIAQSRFVSLAEKARTGALQPLGRFP